MYEVSVETGFSAAHRLADYKGKCENMHGHNWKIVITVESDSLNGCGLAYDFKELKEHASEIIARFDHANLSELPEFSGMNPTTENIARIIYEAMDAKLTGSRARMKKVSAAESDSSRASYRKTV